MQVTLDEIVERYIAEKLKLNKSAFPASTWKTMVDGYVALLCAHHTEENLARLFLLPPAVVVPAIHDMLASLSDQSWPEKTSQPRKASEKKTSGSKANYSEPQQKIRRKTVKPSSAASGSNFNDNLSPAAVITTIKTVDGDYLPVGTAAVPVDLNVKPAELEILNSLSDEDICDLNETLPEYGFLRNHNKLPAKVQSHPYVLLRIPLFIAEKKRTTRVELTNEAFGQVNLRRLALNGYEGFDSVFIEGPAMNSSHFLVWDAIIRCFRETTKAELLNNRAVLEIRASRFLDYLGVKPKYKNKDKRKEIVHCIKTLQQQVITIKRSSNEDLGNKNTPQGQAGLSLINEYIFDEKKDIFRFSVGRSFFDLFGEYQLIPVDTSLVQAMTHEVERIAIIFLTALPTKGTHTLSMRRILDRVKPNGMTRPGRDVDIIIRMMERLKAQGKVNYVLEKNGRDGRDFQYRNFTHNLQRSEPVIMKDGPDLPRKPRTTIDKNDPQNIRRLQLWFAECMATLRNHQEKNKDDRFTFLRIPKIKQLQEVAEILGDKKASQLFENIVRLRK